MNRLPKCKYHKEKFIPKYPFQKFCLSDNECIKAFNEFVKAEKEKQRVKQWQKEKKVIKESLKTKRDYEKELQIQINTIVRLIDKGSFCHSTKKPLNDKFDAGHVFSVGGNPTIRFNLFNIYAQSVYANQYLSGDQINFLAVLSDVYGIEHKEYVLTLKRLYNLIKLTQEDLKEKIKIARQIVKELQNADLTYSAKVRLELRKKYNERLGIYG